MKPSVRKLGFGLVAVVAVVAARAQDSVSLVSGLPGDAVSAYNTAEQRNDFVVDLQSHLSSWGTAFGIAPLIKSSQDSSSPQLFFNHLINAQAISNVRLSGVPFTASSYSLWNAAGLGINDNVVINTPGSPVNTTSFNGFQFGVAFAEAGGTNFASNNIIGGVVNFRANDPTRLYVSRIAAAENAPDGTCKLSSFGMGAVDANGNVVFRADGFGAGVCSGLTPIGTTDSNYFGVDMLGRNSAMLNVASADYPLGMFDAVPTNYMPFGAATTFNCPNIIPESITGGSAIVIGTNFAMQYARGISGPLTMDSTHFSPGMTDQRGNLGYTHNNFAFFPASVNGTAIILAYNAASDAKILDVFGLNATGGPIAPRSLVLPDATITDNSTGFMPSIFGVGHEFDHYHSQVAFQGGSGPAAVGRDQAGNLIAAGVVHYPTPSSTDNPLNYIAVAKIDIVTGGATWTIAGYNDGSFDGSGSGGGTGKPILDGPGGSVIGRMVPLFAVTGGVPLGPSVSAPMIDSVGNVWFLSAVELFKVDEDQVPYSDFDSALLRAVYNPATFSYELEMVFEVGDVIAGRNSALDYQIRFVTIADSNSVSSGTAFSSNILQQPHTTITPLCYPNIATRRPESLGGLVVGASIVYDVDANGDFESLSANPATPDQQYSALLYVGSIKKPSVFGDVNNSGLVNLDDILCVLAGFSNFNTCPKGDLAPCGGNGLINLDDILRVLGAFAGQNPCANVCL